MDGAVIRRTQPFLRANVLQERHALIEPFADCRFGCIKRPQPDYQQNWGRCDQNCQRQRILDFSRQKHGSSVNDENCERVGPVEDFAKALYGDREDRETKEDHISKGDFD